MSTNFKQNYYTEFYIKINTTFLVLVIIYNAAQMKVSLKVNIYTQDV